MDPPVPVGLQHQRGILHLRRYDPRQATEADMDRRSLEVRQHPRRAYASGGTVCIYDISALGACLR